MNNGLDSSRRQFCAAALPLAAWPRILSAQGASSQDKALARKILADQQLEDVRKRGLALLRTGLRAGSGYPEVWIRDMNTFIEAALQVNGAAPLREALLNFCELQGLGGDIVDGFVPIGKSQEPPYRTSPKLPQYVAFKNTVESDQESSLVSAVRKYVDVTRDRSILDEAVSGKTVRERLQLALSYVLKGRWDASRGLVWGGTTVDWGDVQPEDFPGTHLDARSHKAISIYANAMLAIAIADYGSLLESGAAARQYWEKTGATLRRQIRSELWSEREQAFIPHLYLAGSPFPPDLDESKIYYHGGTAIAIEAGLLSREEVAGALGRMRENVKRAGAGSIGLTVYPPYPSGIFKDPILREPYTYQNGGDWCWFGGRMIQQLVRYGLAADAYVELQPMVGRILKAGDFYEWWSRGNEPRGSGAFRGGAGVMVKTIDVLRSWAAQQS